MGGKTLQTRTGLGKLYREIAHRHSHGGAAQVALWMAHLAMSATGASRASP